jgi:hypothetical protein
MEVTHNITIDMVRKGVSPRVYAMQFDTNTRSVRVTMLSDGEPWEPPAGAAVSLSYRKADGTKGFYNRLSDDKSAVSVDRNIVTVVFAHQVLTAPGKVDAALVVHSGDLRIAAFPFEIHVTPDPSAGTTNSDDYFNPGIGSAPGKLKTYDGVVSGNTVTLNYTLEGGETHKDVITFNADGYPVSLVHDGVEATGTWLETSDE